MWLTRPAFWCLPDPRFTRCLGGFGPTLDPSSRWANDTPVVSRIRRSSSLTESSNGPLSVVSPVFLKARFDRFALKSRDAKTH